MLCVLLDDAGHVVDADVAAAAHVNVSHSKLAFRPVVRAIDATHTLVSISTLGGVLRDQGKLEAAKLLLLEALTTARETLGYDHRTTLRAAGRLSDVYRLCGDLASAREPQLQGVVAASRAARGDEAEITLILEGTEGLQMLAERHDPTLLHAALARMCTILGEHHQITQR